LFLILKYNLVALSEMGSKVSRDLILEINSLLATMGAHLVGYQMRIPTT